MCNPVYQGNSFLCMSLCFLPFHAGAHSTCALLCATKLWAQVGRGGRRASLYLLVGWSTWAMLSCSWYPHSGASGQYYLQLVATTNKHAEKATKKQSGRKDAVTKPSTSLRGCLQVCVCVGVWVCGCGCGCVA